MKYKIVALAIMSALSTDAYSAEGTNKEVLEELKSQIQILQNQIEKLEQKVTETDEKVELSVSAIEENMSEKSNSGVAIGGYGELHYNNIEDDEMIDFHRFVLFFGYEFTENVRFFSELEIEHALAGDGKPGEVELEQAYVEIDINENSSVKSGVFLMPVGILNETHEPPTFYGVERNPIEKDIIPATWWEAGAGINTRFSQGLSADFAVHSGLNVPTDGSKAFLIRSGRQKVASAKADSLAYTARIKYTAIPGLELAASYQIQEDVTQGILNSDASLFTAHAILNKGSFGLRALYAAWDIDGSEAKALGRDTQEGYYIEPSVRLNDQFGLFARYNAWDNTAGNSLATEKKQTSLGLNYWPHENVVFKLDLENRSGSHDGNGFNLGVGYQF